MKSYLMTMIPLIAGILIVLVVSALGADRADPASRKLQQPRRDRISLWVSIIALLLPAILMITMIPGTRLFGGSLLVTESARYFALVYLLLTALILLLTHGYFARILVNGTDWRLIVLCMSLGALHLFFANDLPTMFVAFQLVSIPTYALVGFTRIDRRSNEAGMKYLILGLMSGALMLLGISFMYGATGEINLSAIRDALLVPFDQETRTQDGVNSLRGLGLAAMILILVGLFFKTATAPFHSYLLDVYHGSSFAATAIVAVPAKVAYFALLAKLLHGPFLEFTEVWKPLIAAGAVLSFAFGGMQGLAQTNLKRILACSSVINTGFIILAIAFAPPAVVWFYLFSYGLMTIALLGFWMQLGYRYADMDTAADLSGLGRRDPLTAIGLTVALLSLAGIPLTAGFIAKFSVILGVFQGAASEANFANIVTTLGVLGSVLAAYFYFGLIRSIWFRREAPVVPAAAGPQDRRWNFALVAWLAVVLLAILGLYPFPLLR
ncbi:MAG: NADH-quinone oxidoreductase subunit N [bacterium]|nr:NADH-quinone oxidoreductase subunit N [bacterium]